jgi:hypothetical protein
MAALNRWRGPNGLARLLLGVMLGGAGASACGSPYVLASEHASNPGGKVELHNAAGSRPEVAPGQLLVRYLRAGGVYFEWQGQALMTAPFASNYPYVASPSSRRHRSRQRQTNPFRSLFTQRIKPDRRAIDFVLGDELELHRVHALLVGHSHYDHLGDVPDLMTRKLPHATLYTNRAAGYMLAGEAELRGRVVPLDARSGWLAAGPAGVRSLIRFRAIESGHAPNVRLFCDSFSWAEGTVSAPWSTPLRGHKLSQLKVGVTYAFLIDFLDPSDPTEIAFRVHYQDAASKPPEGYPSELLLAERAVDLEVVTMPGREALPAGEGRYPVGVLRHNRARHALVIHYESFFHPVSEVRLLDTLVGGPSEELLDSVAESIVPSSCGPPAAVEGLRAATFTVPLPGQWLVFETALSDPNCR